MIAATAQTDCPPYNYNDLYAGTLHRACKALGSIAALARALRMRPNTVNLMLQGRTRIPHSVFLAAVDILLRSAAS
jgi:hypothetical protein